MVSRCENHAAPFKINKDIAQISYKVCIPVHSSGHGTPGTPHLPALLRIKRLQNQKMGEASLPRRPSRWRSLQLRVLSAYAMSPRVSQMFSVGWYRAGSPGQE
jgi:hypothetical protein